MWYHDDAEGNDFETLIIKEDEKIKSSIEKIQPKKKKNGSKNLDYFLRDRIVVGESFIDQEQWKIDFEKTFKKQELSKVRKKKLKKFYEKQNEFIEEYEEANELKEEFENKTKENFNTNTSSSVDVDSKAELLKEEMDELDIEEDEEPIKKKRSGFLCLKFGGSVNQMSKQRKIFWVKFCVTASYSCNILLFVLKITAAILSMSLTIITSALDSALDLLSGAILYTTSRIRHKKKRNDWYKYPVGKARYEPLGFLIFACVMSTASVMIIKQGVTDIFTGFVDTVRQIFDATYAQEVASQQSTSLLPPIVDFALFWFGVGVILFTIIVKSGLFILCFIFRDSPTVRAYMVDHRNDAVSNFGLLIALTISGIFPKFFWWLDPLTATVLSCAIILNWVGESKQYVKKLVGRSASPQFLSKVTYMAMNHHPSILHVESIQAFHIGENLYVEVDIVVSPTMRTREAHDIAEKLQQKIELFEDVERAFVHIDYEVEHKKEEEHKKIT